MKVVEIKITNPQDREAVAKEVGSTIADVLAGVANKQKKSDKMSEELKSDVDGMDGEEIEALTLTDDFKAYNEELGKKVNDLNEFIDKNHKRYNGGIVIGVASITGKSTVGGGATFIGRGDAILAALERIMDEDQLCAMVERILSRRHILKHIIQFTGENEKTEETENDLDGTDVDTCNENESAN